MSVWYCIPSARPVAEAAPVLAKWRQQGYKIALYTDEPTELDCDLSMHGEYPGYAKAVNQLVQTVFAYDSEADWVVTGGDDIEPDLAHAADVIAAECSGWFAAEAIERRDFEYEAVRGLIAQVAEQSTYGVMQPTGDRWGENTPGFPHYEAYIDRVCGSPWLGREFCRRVNGGNGPLHPGYSHMYVDEELQAVAKFLGILWQRRDLIHYHRHWARKPGTTMQECPEFLRAANSEAGWAEAKALFLSRKDAGFPGHQPCA